MIKAIIFDCFGVLVADDLKMRIQAVDKVNPKAGLALHDLLRAIDRGMVSPQESIKQMGELMGVDPQELKQSIEASLIKNTQLTAHIRTLKPHYKVALLSNVRGRSRLEELFDHGELDELFDAVVASGDIGIIKPEPAIYEYTAEQLGVSTQECVMIDDIQRFCDGAEAVGMRSILFKDTDQAIHDLDALIDTEGQTH